MLVKLGVDISRLNRPIRRTLNKIEVIFRTHLEEPVITSTYEGDHSCGSLHYTNDAIDVRNPKTNANIIFIELKKVLGTDFDILQLSNHVHIEYDPKE